MTRKCHVRFGGGRLEKGQQCHLASRLPNVVDREDWQANERALLEGTRLLSAYTLPQTGEKVWVIVRRDKRSSISA